MKIGFIGAGKVGFSLGKYFAINGASVVGFYSKFCEDAQAAAIFTDSKCFLDLKSLIRECDTLFLTVEDSNISEVYSDICQYDISGKCIAHCSGALSSNIFSDISKFGAKGISVHPICAFADKRYGYKQLQNVCFTVEGSNTDEFVRLLKDFGNRVEIISAEQKTKYHTACVFASNLVVGLYDIATAVLKDGGFSDDFAENAFSPLFLGNAENIVNNGTTDALTGPIERADVETVKAHLATICGENKDIYRLLSRKLVEVAKNKNPDRDYSEMLKQLEE